MSSRGDGTHSAWQLDLAGLETALDRAGEAPHPVTEEDTMTTLLERTRLPMIGAPLGALLMLVALLVGAGRANAAEIIPSVGLAQARGGPQPYYGLAIRQNLAPMIKGELGVAYRSHDYLGGLVKEHQMPITASLWLSPTPVIYVGGGLGWYNSSAGAPFGLPISFSNQKMGAHVGGGLDVPLVPRVASLDLNARYVFMGQQKGLLSSLDALGGDFWTVSAGVGLHF